LTAVITDASVVASWLLPDEANAAGAEYFRRACEFGAAAPAIWEYEVRNILIINFRKGRISEQAALEGSEFLLSLGVKVDRDPIWSDVEALARRFRLTVYDAVYMELSARLRLPLATFDRALGAAARQLGLSADA
jgi:predicted nucleic acid-binding protein